MTAIESFMERWNAHDHKPEGELDYLPMPGPSVIVELIEQLARIESSVTRIEAMVEEIPADLGGY